MVLGLLPLPPACLSSIIMGSNCNCVICNKEMEATGLTPFASSLDSGVIFRSTGNWESSVFDPMTVESQLELYICDSCVTKNAMKIYEITNISKQISGNRQRFEPPQTE